MKIARRADRPARFGYYRERAADAPVANVDGDGRPAIIPQVTGMAYRTGEHVFSIDPHDPLVGRGHG